MMYGGQTPDLNELFDLDSFEGKAVISMSDGQKIGTVEDILIDPGNMSINALVTSVGGFLRPDVKAIPASEIFLWGKDVVLVNQTDVVRKKNDLPGLENCLSAYDNLHGRDVISMQGDRVGELKDVLITAKGELAGFEITRPANGLEDIFSSERDNRRGPFRLPIATLNSFGKDVMMVDLDKVRSLHGTSQPEDMTEASYSGESAAIPVSGPTDHPSEQPFDHDPALDPELGRDRDRDPDRDLR